MKINNKILSYTAILISYIFLLQGNVNAETISVNTTISVDTVYTDLIIQNWATLTLDAVLTVTWNATIESWWNITHSSVATSLFNLEV